MGLEDQMLMIIPENQKVLRALFHYFLISNFFLFGTVSRLSCPCILIVSMEHAWFIG